MERWRLEPRSAWIYELLEEEVEELVVTIPDKRPGPKDDARDAWELAENLRAGAFKRRVYKCQGPYSELRAAVRSYGLLRTDVRRAKSRLKALFRSRALLPPGDEVFDGNKH